jgi:hypothetical protein
VDVVESGAGENRVTGDRAMSTSRRTLLLALALVMVAGCNVSVTVRTFGAASVEDLAAENKYVAVYTSTSESALGNTIVGVPARHTPGSTLAPTAAIEAGPSPGSTT